MPVRNTAAKANAASPLGRCWIQFYTLRDRRDAMRQKAQSVRKTVQNLRDRTQRKLLVQCKEMESAKNREPLRQMGDLVMANLHAIEKGQTVLVAENFYDPEMKPIRIALSPTLTPQQNAAKYYKDYAKAKHAEQELTHQMALAQTELTYLYSVLEELERAETEQELEEIRQELISGGYLRRETGRQRIKQAPAKPMRFTSTDGQPIYVGRQQPAK